MRKFVIKTSCYTIFVIILIALITAITNALVRKKNVFAIDHQYTMVIVGNSHSACGLDDRNIEGSLNLSSESESYLYSYIKIRELLKANSHIKKIFIQFDNLQIDKSRIDDWIWQDSKISKFLWRYGPYMNSIELMHLLDGNACEVLKSQPLLIQKNFEAIRSNDHSLIKNRTFGNNISHQGTHADSLLCLTPDAELRAAEQCTVHELNLSFLQKIIEICAAHHVKLTLIRTPVLPKFQGLFNERKFQQLVRDSLPSVPFIDLKDIVLPAAYYYDLDHLNADGSGLLSNAFNNALQHDDFNLEKMQSDIDEQINSPLASGNSISHPIQ